MGRIFLYVLASSGPALAALPIALLNSAWDQCGSWDSAGLKSQFGCGNGLICNYQNPQYSQCIPNSALDNSLWKSCPTTQLNVIGRGIPVATCAIGSFCKGDQWAALCTPCRTKYTTCPPSATTNTQFGCCPGTNSTHLYSAFLELLKLFVLTIIS